PRGERSPGDRHALRGVHPQGAHPAGEGPPGRMTVAAQSIGSFDNRGERRAQVPEPIDWALAGRIARRVSGRDPLATSYLAGSLASDFAEVTAEAEVLVAEFTGLRAPG